MSVESDGSSWVKHDKCGPLQAYGKGITNQELDSNVFVYNLPDTSQ